MSKFTDGPMKPKGPFTPEEKFAPTGEPLPGCRVTMPQFDERKTLWVLVYALGAIFATGVAAFNGEFSVFLMWLGALWGVLTLVKIAIMADAAQDAAHEDRKARGLC
jgi:hypothetical protein